MDSCDLHTGCWRYNDSSHISFCCSFHYIVYRSSQLNDFRLSFICSVLGQPITCASTSHNLECTAQRAIDQRSNVSIKSHYNSSSFDNVNTTNEPQLHTSNVSRSHMTNGHTYKLDAYPPHTKLSKQTFYKKQFSADINVGRASAEFCLKKTKSQTGANVFVSSIKINEIIARSSRRFMGHVSCCHAKWKNMKLV